MAVITSNVLNAINAFALFRTMYSLKLNKESFVKRIIICYACKIYRVIVRARCSKCENTIQGKCITALDQKWHLEHFNCENCGRSLVGANFVRQGDKPYCKSCPPTGSEKKAKRFG